MEYINFIMAKINSKDRKTAQQKHTGQLLVDGTINKWLIPNPGQESKKIGLSESKEMPKA